MLIKTVIKPGSRRFIVVILHLFKNRCTMYTGLVINLLCINSKEKTLERVK
jgi:hypothetical protein